MLHVEQTTNKELLKYLISDEDIISGFTTKENIDDYIGRIGSDHVCYLLLYKHEVAGVAICLNLCRTMNLKDFFVVDIGFFKEYRGKIALRLSKLALNKFFKENNCKRLISLIYKNNKKALLNAKWCGFKHLSTTKDRYYLEYRKDGRQ